MTKRTIGLLTIILAAVLMTGCVGVSPITGDTTRIEELLEEIKTAESSDQAQFLTTYFTESVKITMTRSEFWPQEVQATAIGEVFDGMSITLDHEELLQFPEMFPWIEEFVAQDAIALDVLFPPIRNLFEDHVVDLEKSPEYLISVSQSGDSAEAVLSFTLEDLEQEGVPSTWTGFTVTYGFSLKKLSGEWKISQLSFSAAIEKDGPTPR